MKKSIAAIILIAAMLLTALGSCKLNPNNTPDASTAPTADPNTQASPAPTGDGTPATPVPKGEELYAIDGDPVYESEFRFWMYQTLNSLGIDPKGEIDWEFEVPGSILPLDEFLKSEAESTSRIYRQVLVQADTLGLTLTDEELEYLDNLRQQYIDYLKQGNEDYDPDQAQADYEAFLADAGLTEELLQYTEKVSIIYGKLQPAMFGDDATFTQEEINAVGEEDKIYRAKHILFTFPENEDGSEPTEEQRQATLDKAKETYDSLKGIEGAEQLLAAFDAKMKELSEDPGKDSSPEGYQFVPGVMVQSFTDTAAALEYNAMSEPVDIDYGYSIILRLPLDLDLEVMMGGYYESPTLRELVPNLELQHKVRDAADSMTIASTPEYEDMDVPAFLAGN